MRHFAAFLFCAGIVRAGIIDGPGYIESPTVTVTAVNELSTSNDILTVYSTADIFIGPVALSGYSGFNPYIAPPLCIAVQDCFGEVLAQYKILGAYDYSDASQQTIAGHTFQEQFIDFRYHSYANQIHAILAPGDYLFSESIQSFGDPVYATGNISSLYLGFEVNSGSVGITAAPAVPEPSTMLMLTAGPVALIVVRRRMRRRPLDTEVTCDSYIA